MIYNITYTIMLIMFIIGILSYSRIKFYITKSKTIRRINKISFIISGNILLITFTVPLAWVIFYVFETFGVLLELRLEVKVYLSFVTLLLFLIRSKNVPSYYLNRIMTNFIEKDDAAIITGWATSIFSTFLRPTIYFLGFIIVLILNSITLSNNSHLIPIKVINITDVSNYILVSILAFDTAISCLESEINNLKKSLKLDINTNNK